LLEIGGYKFTITSVNMTVMRRVILFTGAVLLFVSCLTSSGGKVDDVPRLNKFAGLPAGAPVYVSADVGPSRELLEEFLTAYKYRLNGKTIKTFFDKTSEVAAAVYPRIGAMERRERAFLLACYGKNYPAVLSSFSFFFSPSWKQVKSVTGKKYWRSSKNRISLDMRRDKAYISDADPFFEGESAEPPESFTDFSAGSRMSVWIRDVSLLNDALARIDIPVTVPAEAIFIAVFENEGYWQASFCIETPSAAHARGLVMMLSLVRGALAGGRIAGGPGVEFARMLLSEPPALDGSALTLKSPVMTRAEIARLITLLSIYLK
jgi:hypothetical protein